MTDSARPLVVIGGTNDMRRVQALYGDRINLPVVRNIDEAMGRVDVAALEQISAVREEYRVFRHGLGGQEFAVWVPSTWDDERAGREVFGRIANLWAAKLGKAVG